MTGPSDRGAPPPDESDTHPEVKRPEVVDAAPVVAGMLLAGRYEIQKILGRGGMGVVVSAMDHALGEEVAIKILRAEYAGERQWAERLAREVKLARQIHHPNVCRVFDFEQAEGRAFLVMELAIGSVREEIASGALMQRSPSDRIADANAVAAGLAAIHAAGIVHRDLSPQNVLRMSDGRLVVADFGLATDASESTTSLHGGTIAYMAPDVARGERATVASDLWSLGVVTHEIVFGVKPRWCEPGKAEMLVPLLGRRLVNEEREALARCRQWTTERAKIRNRSWRSIGRSQRRRRLIAIGLAACGAVGILAAALPRHMRDTSPKSLKDVIDLKMSGTPVDLSRVAQTLAEVPDRIECLVSLRDDRTLRFVWGTPRRAEDLDAETGVRHPAPLLAQTYAEGCPDLSPDGKHLVYQGHVPDGRAFAFVAPNPDGRDAAPVVQIAEPTLSSEPKWLSDNTSFVYDVDTVHGAVFSTSTRHAIILPTSGEEVLSAYKYVSGDRAYVEAVGQSGRTEFVGIRWPSMQVDVHFALPVFTLDLVPVTKSRYFVLARYPGTLPIVGRIDLDKQVFERTLSSPDQIIRYPTLVGAGMVIATIEMRTELTWMKRDGAAIQIAANGSVQGAARCGSDVVASVFINQRAHLVRIRPDGTEIDMTSGPIDASPTCSPDGRLLFYTYLDSGGAHVRRCDNSGCRVFMDRSVSGLAVSPDGSRLAFISLEGHDPSVRVMSTDGGESRPIVPAEAACPTGWASETTLWVSRRRNGHPVWIEVDEATGAETGRVVQGAKDCFDNTPDPASPVQPELRFSINRRSQIRRVPAASLTWRED